MKMIKRSIQFLQFTFFLNDIYDKKTIHFEWNIRFLSISFFYNENNPTERSIFGILKKSWNLFLVTFIALD